MSVYCYDYKAIETYFNDVVDVPMESQEGSEQQGAMDVSYQSQPEEDMEQEAVVGEVGQEGDKETGDKNGDDEGKGKMDEEDEKGTGDKKREDGGKGEMDEETRGEEKEKGDKRGGNGGKGEVDEEAGGEEKEKGDKREGDGGKGEVDEETGGEEKEKGDKRGGGGGKGEVDEETGREEKETGGERETGDEKMETEGKKQVGDTKKKRESATKADVKKVKQAKLEKKKKEAPLPKFPTTIEEFGYAFNDSECAYHCQLVCSVCCKAIAYLPHTEGQLRHKKTGEPFAFVVKEGDQRYNQAHYEALGEVTVGVVVTQC